MFQLGWYKVGSIFPLLYFPKAFAKYFANWWSQSAKISHWHSLVMAFYINLKKLKNIPSVFSQFIDLKKLIGRYKNWTSHVYNTLFFGKRKRWNKFLIWAFKHRSPCFLISLVLQWKVLYIFFIKTYWLPETRSFV